MSEELIRAVVDLGWCMVRLQGSPVKNTLELIIASPSSEGDGFHGPAESVTIHSTPNVKKLRDFLNEHLPEEQA